MFRLGCIKNCTSKFFGIKPLNTLLSTIVHNLSQFVWDKYSKVDFKSQAFLSYDKKTCAAQLTKWISCAAQEKRA